MYSLLVSYICVRCAERRSPFRVIDSQLITRVDFEAETCDHCGFSRRATFVDGLSGQYYFYRDMLAIEPMALIPHPELFGTFDEGIIDLELIHAMHLESLKVRAIAFDAGYRRANQGALNLEFLGIRQFGKVVEFHFERLAGARVGTGPDYAELRDYLLDVAGDDYELQLLACRVALHRTRPIHMGSVSL